MNPALDSPRTQRFGKYALVERLGRFLVELAAAKMDETFPY